jgi:hypothetical protein
MKLIRSIASLLSLAGVAAAADAVDAARTSAPTVDPLSLHTDVGEGYCADANNQTYSHMSAMFASPSLSNEKTAANYCAQNMVSILFI